MRSIGLYIDHLMKNLSLLIITNLISLFCLASPAKKPDIYLGASERAAITIGLQSLHSFNAMTGLLNELQKTTAIIENHQVQSYPEFLELETGRTAFQDQSLNEITPEELYKLLPLKKITSPNAQVQAKINLYYETKTKLQAEKISQLALPALEVLKSTNQDPTEIKTQITNRFNVEVDRLMKGFAKTDSNFLYIVDFVIKSYFKNRSFQKQLETLYELTSLPLNSPSSGHLTVLLRSAGPQMLKMFQIFARSPEVSQEFKDIFQSIESQNKVTSWKQVQKILAVEGISLEDFSYFERKPLGVGSMAQVHRVQKKTTDKTQRNYVLRFLKPGIEKEVQLDHAVMKKIFAELDQDTETKKRGFSDLSKINENLNQILIEELNVEQTYLNQQQAKYIYETETLLQFDGQKNYLSLQVPDAQLIGKSKTVMLQSLVIGKSPSSAIQDYRNLYPELYSKIAEALVEKWVEVAFFADGFFHSDLHQGNLKLLITDDKIKLSLLDFGMVGRLDKKTQSAALELAIGIKLQNAGMITDAFLKLQQKTLTPAAVKVFKNSAITQLKLHADWDIKEWTNWSLQMGIEHNNEFLKLNRAMLTLENFLLDAKSMESVESLAERVAKRNLTKVLPQCLNVIRQ